MAALTDFFRRSKHAVTNALHIAQKINENALLIFPYPAQTILLF